MITIIFGTAHLMSTPGKCSPDKQFYEYKYSREVCKALKGIFKEMGYNTFIDIEDDDLDLTPSKELVKRCQIVNDLVRKYKDCIYISIHVNAASSDGKWHNATGWEAYTTKGKTKSDQLAEELYKSAIKNLKGKKVRKDTTDGDSDKEADFYVLRKTICPAVLTENFFQDNKEDVEYLQSNEGFHQIIRTHVEGIFNYIKDNQ